MPPFWIIVAQADSEYHRKIRNWQQNKIICDRETVCLQSFNQIAADDIRDKQNKRYGGNQRICPFWKLFCKSPNQRDQRIDEKRCSDREDKDRPKADIPPDIASVPAFCVVIPQAKSVMKMIKYPTNQKFEPAADQRTQQNDFPFWIPYRSCRKEKNDRAESINRQPGPDSVPAPGKKSIIDEVKEFLIDPAWDPCDHENETDGQHRLLFCKCFAAKRIPSAQFHCPRSDTVIEYVFILDK